MKYSLRSLMVAVLVLPPLLAWGLWYFIPPRLPVAGTPESKSRFLRVLKRPNPGDEIHAAAKECFVVGSPASLYDDVFSRADSTLTPSPTRTQYVFRFGATEGGAFVIVNVEGKPPRIFDTRILIPTY